ncbi:MAG: YfcE family phosphodiesterase [Clostridiaceae bacterium]|nr:YfcE family phosphodiesterase [Clostridiaceae bacterium]
MKICVCSDSHGNRKGLQEMLDRERPELVLFLGDGERDWSAVDIPRQTMFSAVCGNCDLMAMEPPFRRIELCGKRIFMTHGHLYGAKQGLYGLRLQAEKSPTDLVLYGHTHHPQLDNEDGCLYLCPGSMGYGEERYAVVDLSEHEEHISVSFRRL